LTDKATEFERTRFGWWATVTTFEMIDEVRETQVGKVIVTGSGTTTVTVWRPSKRWAARAARAELR